MFDCSKPPWTWATTWTPKKKMQAARWLRREVLSSQKSSTPKFKDFYDQEVQGFSLNYFPRRKRSIVSMGKQRNKKFVPFSQDCWWRIHWRGEGKPLRGEDSFLQEEPQYGVIIYCIELVSSFLLWNEFFFHFIPSAETSGQLPKHLTKFFSAFMNSSRIQNRFNGMVTLEWPNWKMKRNFIFDDTDNVLQKFWSRFRPGKNCLRLRNEHFINCQNTLPQCWSNICGVIFSFPISFIGNFKFWVLPINIKSRRFKMRAKKDPTCLFSTWFRYPPFLDFETSFNARWLI